MTIISIHVSPICNYNHLFTINLYVIIIKLVTYRAIAIYDAYIVPRATEDCEKLAVSEFNADLIADKRARVYRIINDTRSAEVSGQEWPSLMNDFRVNPERSCKLAARRFAQELDARFPRSSLSLSLPPVAVARVTFSHVLFSE